MLPLAARRNRFLRTDTLPFSFARSIISPNFLTCRRRSIVRLLTPKKAAISSSEHCRPHSFSSSERSILALGRGMFTHFLFEQTQLAAPVREREAQSWQVGMPREDQRL